MRMIDSHPGRRAARGVSLIEVLVALVILSVGVLALSRLQATQLRANTGAYLRTQAAIQAYDMADRMRANQAGVDAGNYDAVTGIPSNPGCIATGCTTAELADFDAWEWNTQNARVLPNGTGTIVAAGNVHTITIAWQVSGLNGAENKTFTLGVQP